jgi:hypothetical protein
MGDLTSPALYGIERPRERADPECLDTGQDISREWEGCASIKMVAMHIGDADEAIYLSASAVHFSVLIYRASVCMPPYQPPSPEILYPAGAIESLYHGPFPC